VKQEEIKVEKTALKSLNKDFFRDFVSQTSRFFYRSEQEKKEN